MSTSAYYAWAGRRHTGPTHSDLDEAYLVNIMGVDTLLVAKGDGSLLVNIMGGEKEDHPHALSDLAKKALDKL